MAVILMILSIICFVGSLVLLFYKEAVAPAVALLGLVAMYFSHKLPLAPNMVITWVAITVIILGVTSMQSRALMAQTRGMGYMLTGAIAGMAVGLIAVPAAESLTFLYACMILGIVAGIFFAFMLFSRTPQGRDVNLASGNFFTYLAAKGFPLALTVIQAGVCILLALVSSY